MRCPTRLAPLALLALLLCSPHVSAADPYVTLSWDHVATAGQQVAVKSFTGPGPYDLYVAVTGQSVPVRAFEVVLLIHAGNGLACFQDQLRPVPAAWRFDAGGCADGHLCYEGGALVPPDPVAQAGRLFLSDLTYDPTVLASKLTFVEADPLPLATPDPTQTYRLVHFRFEHLGTCAGEADTVNVGILLAHWLDKDTDGTESAWTIAEPSLLGWNAPAIEGECATLGVPALTGQAAPASLLAAALPARTQSAFPACDAAVPARSTSWGLVKATYR